MCGISGIYARAGRAVVDTALLAAMTDAVRHRGPDDEGYLLVSRQAGELRSYSGKDSTEEIAQALPRLDYGFEASLGMGFRRLSIIDLSVCGHQPMLWQEEGLAITFNGEIYNYPELASELKGLGYSFTSQSDTEVILKAYRHWGEDCVKRFNGIWAFAIWDAKRAELFLSRDRYGVKPLYYAEDDGFIYWGSEIKQLLLAPIDKSLNTAMIWRSMKINSLLVYEDDTNWRHIHSLKPGHNLLIKEGHKHFSTYYSLDPESFESSNLSFERAVEEYRELFQDSLRLQMRSDVEVAASLSGGMDSSAIVCAAYAKEGASMQTFSTYYAEDESLDERKWIRLVAEHCNARAHYISPGVEQARDSLREVTYYNDLPTRAGYTSQWALMKGVHSAGIKVLLSGQGSDELLAGYKHAAYRYFADLLRAGKLKDFGHNFAGHYHGRGLGASAAALGKTVLSAILPESSLYKLEFEHYRFEPFGREFRKQASAMAEGQILGGIRDLKASRLSNFLFNMLFSTSIQTLLHLEDRMSGANSVESRVPFLDHRLVDYCFSLPSRYKIAPPYQKYIHRKAMQPLIPPEIYARKDKGIFSSPFYSSWMRGGLRSAFEEVFYSTAFRERGIWDLPMIHKEWHAYLAGKSSQAEMLFNVMALEIWFEVHIDGK